MRGICHILLHLYYVLIAAVIVYGDRLATAGLPYGFLNELRSAISIEVFVGILVFMDLARAPDCDISCSRTVFGFLAYLPLKPFLRSHRGWYHSVWAAAYVAAICTALMTAIAYAAMTYLPLWISGVRLGELAATVYVLSFSSYVLHLAEDTLTVGGLKWSSLRLRGLIRTGRSDLVLTLLMILTSLVILIATYIVTSTLSYSGIAAAATLVVEYGLIISAGSLR